MLLTNCRYIVTQNSKRDILEQVDILIQDNRITAVGKHLQKKYPREKTLDCTDRIVMPGLVNCHTHTAMTGLRGFLDDKELLAWLPAINAARRREDAAKEQHNCFLGMSEALQTGTTTLVDNNQHHIKNELPAQLLGIRLVNFPMFFNEFKKIDQEDISTCLTPGGFKTGIAVHSIYGVDEAFLHAIREYATIRKIMIHLHLAETRKERVECKKRTGMLPIEYLEHLGFLGPDVLIAHCVWVTKGELDILAKHRIRIVHCPQSNMKLASGGVMPLREMHERGIVVGLGTDSTASNNSLDMFREMHVCALLHKHHYWDPTMANAQTVLDMATIAGARALGLPDIGSIEAGKLADIITLDATDVNLQPLARERIVSHLVYAANGMNVSEVIVDGKLLVKKKKSIRT